MPYFPFNNRFDWIIKICVGNKKIGYLGTSYYRIIQISNNNISNKQTIKKIISSNRKPQRSNKKILSNTVTITDSNNKFYCLDILLWWR